MKAIDYYNETKEILFPSYIPINLTLVEETVADLRKRFMHEIVEICEARKIVRLDSQRSVVNEVNQKWNALVGIFEKRHGLSPLNRNAIVECFDYLIQKRTDELNESL